MNASTPGSLTIVIQERRAKTLWDHFCVHVSRGLREMERFVKTVSQHEML